MGAIMGGEGAGVEAIGRSIGGELSLQSKLSQSQESEEGASGSPCLASRAARPATLGFSA